MDYGNILKRAGQITWRYKFLWIFGIIMAMCGQGGGSRSNIKMNYQTSAPFDPETGVPDFPAFFPEPFGQTPIIVFIIALLILMLIFMLIGLIVGAIGRSALIKSVDRVETGESISLSTSWKDGLSKAIPMGLLQLLLSIPLFILMAVVMIIVLVQFLPFFYNMFEFSETMQNFDSGSQASPEMPPFMEDFFLFFPLFFSAICGFICLAFIIQVIMAIFLTFGARAIVLEDKGVIASLGRGWTVFRQNIAASIILAIIAFVIAMVVSFAIAIPAMIIIIPVMLSTMPRLFSGDGLSVGNYLLMGGAAIIIYLVASFIGGVLLVFTEALWTLAYREFTIGG